MFSRNILLRTVLALAAAFLAFRYYDSFQSARDFLPFRVVTLPNRGKGLIATRDIMQGEMIIKEPPLFLVHAGSFQDLGSHIRSTISALNGTSRSTFFELSHPLESKDANMPLAIFQTNSIEIGEISAGIFPLTSRMNHGCSKAFNSVHSWREDGLIVVHALKHIRKGEEILREYINTQQPRKKRRAELFEVYGFDCSCSVCSLPPGDAGRSDVRLSSMATIQAEFSKWNEGNLDGREAVRLVKRVWALGEKESYWRGRGRLAEDVVNIAAAHHDLKAGREWAYLSLEWYSYELGYDSKEVERMRVLSSDPSKHPSWATREELRVGGPDMVLM